MIRVCVAVMAILAISAIEAASQGAIDLGIKGLNDSLIGSWANSQEVDLGDGTTGTFSVVITFADERFTLSVELENLDPEDPTPLTAVGTGVYVADTAVTPNRLATTYQVINGEPFESTFFYIYEIAGATLRLGSNDMNTYPTSFESATIIEEYAAVGERSVCSETTVGALMTQLSTFRSMAKLPEDFDGDGVPESVILELVRFVSCDGDTKVPTRTTISEATQSAFLVNVSALRQAGVTEFAEVAALLGLSSNATQAQVRAALANLGFTAPELTLVTCNDNDCRADDSLGNQVFSGGGDLDGDGATNRQEFDAGGGDTNAFLDAATDNFPAGGNGNGGCSASGSDAGMNVWDALLLAIVLLGTAVLSRWRTVA